MIATKANSKGSWVPDGSSGTRRWEIAGVDDLQPAWLSDPDPKCPHRLIGAPPMVERLWRVALADVESNIINIDGALFFGAGRTFGKMLYERDIAYSGILSLNALYPEVMLDSIRYTRRLRQTLGMRVSTNCDLSSLGIRCEVEPITEQEFMQRYLTNSYSRRTDDVLWLWAIDDLLQRTGDNLQTVRWAYETGQRFFDQFYAPFLDPADGLYRGQASFIDAHYSSGDLATAYPPHWSLHDCLSIKATSTNCLYYRGMRAMARFADLLEDIHGAAKWKKSAEILRQAIRNKLRADDGTFAFYRNADGSLSARAEAVGTALVVMLDIVTGDEARQALHGIPITWKGAPLLHPFEPWTAFYHNHSSWPFVDAFLLKAHTHFDGVDRTRMILDLSARSCTPDGSFHEVIDFRTGVPTGSKRQLWTAAAFLCGGLEGVKSRQWITNNQLSRIPCAT